MNAGAILLFVVLVAFVVMGGVILS